MRYPDYVKNFRPKGTVVKKVGETYYAYYATSKRVPGKKYPVQVIKGLAGRIDAQGFHEQTRMVLDTKEVTIRECGFTNYLLLSEDEYAARLSYMQVNGKSIPMRTRREIYRSLIVYLSDNSYLNESTWRIYTTEELADKFGIGIPTQLGVVSRVLERPLSELAPLKYICEVEIDGKHFESKLTKAQAEMLERLGIDEEDIRRREE